MLWWGRVCTSDKAVTSFLLPASFSHQRPHQSKYKYTLIHSVCHKIEKGRRLSSSFLLTSYDLFSTHQQVFSKTSTELKQAHLYQSWTRTVWISFIFIIVQDTTSNIHIFYLQMIRQIIFYSQNALRERQKVKKLIGPFLSHQYLERCGLRPSKLYIIKNLVRIHSPTWIKNTCGDLCDYPECANTKHFIVKYLKLLSDCAYFKPWLFFFFPVKPNMHI